MRNVFFKVAIKTLVKSKKRAMATLVGIVISVSLITGTLVTSEIFQRFFREVSSSNYGSWKLATEGVEKDELKNQNFSKKDYGIIKNLGYITVPGNGGVELIKLASPDENANKMVNVSYQEGRAPQNEGEIALSKVVLDKLAGGYKVGDKITLGVYSQSILKKEKKRDGYESNYNSSSGNEKKEEKSKKTLEQWGQDPAHIRDLIGTNQDVQYRQFTLSGIIKSHKLSIGGQNQDFMITKSNVEYQKTDTLLFGPAGTHEIGKIEKALRKAGHVVEHNKELISLANFETSGNFGGIGLITIGILILVSIGGWMLMYNTFAISLRERKLAYNVMESTGATFKQRRMIPVYESAFFSIIGIPTGVLFGLVGVQGLIYLFGDEVTKLISPNTDIHMTLQLRWDIIIFAAIISIIVVNLSSIFPYYKEEIHRTTHEKHRGRFLNREPKLLNRIADKVGITGRLAYKSFSKNKRHYKTTIASISFTLFIFIASSGIMTYVQGFSRDMLGNSGDYDISYSVKGAEHSINDVYNKFKDVRNIISRGYNYQGIIKVDVEDFPLTYNVQVLDDESYRKYLRDNNISGNTHTPHGDDVIDDKIIESNGNRGSDKKAKVLDSVGITKILMYNKKTGRVESHNLFSGENKPAYMTGKINGEKVIIRFSGYTSKRPMVSREGVGQPTIVTSYSSAKAVFGKSLERDFTKEIFFKSSNPKETYSDIQSAIKNSDLTEDGLTNIYKDREDVNRALVVIKVFSYGFILLMSIVTIANIFNTLSSNMQIKRVEFVSLISIGATDKDIIKTIVLENAFIGAKGIIYGVLAALLFLIIPYNGLEISSLTGYILPVGSIIISILFVIVTVLTVSAYIIHKLHKNVLKSAITILKENNL